MTTFMYYLFLIEMILLRHMNLPNLDSKTILEKFYTAMPMKHFLLTLVIILRHSNLRTRNSFHHQQPRSSCLQLDFSQ